LTMTCAEDPAFGLSPADIGYRVETESHNEFTRYLGITRWGRNRRILNAWQNERSGPVGPA
jgi:hypothetical protein